MRENLIYHLLHDMANTLSNQQKNYIFPDKWFSIDTVESPHCRSSNYLQKKNKKAPK